MENWKRDIIMEYVYPKADWLVRPHKWLPLGVAHHRSYRSDEWFLKIFGRLFILWLKDPFIPFR
jgi:hypothetical protein